MIAVDLRQPLVGVLEEVRVGAAVVLLLGRQPAGEAAAVDLGVDVRRGAGDHVEAGLLGHVEQLVDVADAGEVVDARRRRVVVPVEVQRGRVEAGGLHLLEDVEPQVRAGQPEVVELARPQVDALAVDLERVAVEGDRVRGIVGLCRRSLPPGCSPPGGRRAARRPGRPAGTGRRPARRQSPPLSRAGARCASRSGSHRCAARASCLQVRSARTTTDLDSLDTNDATTNDAIASVALISVGLR